MQKAEVPDLHEALRENVLEEPAEKLDAVKGGGSWAATAGFTGGEGDGTVLESHETSMGDGAPEDRGGEGGAGGVTIAPRLRVDIPGDGPDLGGDVLPQSGVAHVVFEDGAGERRESLPRDQEGGSGGEPGGAVLGEATARDAGVHGGMVRELPAPGVQDPWKARQVRTDTTLGCGAAFAGERRGVESGLVGEALRRAAEGSECLRDGEGDEKVRPEELFVQVVV
jgi:hypothetical protein